MRIQLPLASLVTLVMVATSCSGENDATTTGEVGGSSSSAKGGATGSGVTNTTNTNAAGGSTANASGGTVTNGDSSSNLTALGGSALGGSSSSKMVNTAGGTNSQSSGKTSAGGNAVGGANSSSGGKSSAGGSTTGGSKTTGSASNPSGGASGAGTNPKVGGATSTGGTTSTANTSGAAGSSSTSTSPGLCKFASGLNIAWVNFAADVPNPNITTFSKIFKDTYDNGGRIVRWWFHTNGTSTPGYNSDGTVKKIPQSHIDDVKKILAAANAAKVGVVISLWSFDMAQDNAGNTATQNQALLTTDSLRQSYIDNYLTDLVKGLKGTPGLYAYEIFNEPEGMETTGWATKFKLDKKYIQMAVNWWSAAIHEADPSVLVTSSAQTMDFCSGVSGKRNDYSDSELTTVGGKANGTLDFYQVHYYQVNGSSDNVFAYPRSHWNLTDKKLVIGEFAAYANDTSPVAVDDSFTYLFTNGYDGAWGWSYTEGNSNYAWPSMKTPMNNLHTAQQATIDACP